MAFATIPELLAEIRAGRMVVLADDEDRENEGDLIMAASAVRPEDINFMARHARGLICLSLTRTRCEKLGLGLMVNDNRSPYQTAFTVSIEARSGVTTGISAFDRAHTIRTAVANDAKPDDLRQPGHIFPLMAQPGGVLKRAGHTEAACDLAALAGFEPAGVLVEILAEDGTMARRPELEKFARAHDLKMGTIADLIRYRLETEKSIERISERDVQTDFGAFRCIAYRDLLSHELHYAFIRGTMDAQTATLVRVHVSDYFSDVLSIRSSGAPTPLRAALAAIDRVGHGAAVVLQGAMDSHAQLRRLQPSDAEKPSDGGQWRTHGLGAQILKDLGIRKLRVLGKTRTFLGLSGFGLEVVESVSWDAAR